MTDPIVKTLKIVNEKGLHARASAKLVEVVEGFDARCKVSKGCPSDGSITASVRPLVDARAVLAMKLSCMSALCGKWFCV